MNDSQPTWSEENSETYAKLAQVAVPAREEQLAALLSLVQFGRDAAFKAVELGSGEGFLSQALLTAYPNAAMTALDGSELMRQRTAQRLAEFGQRAQVAPFDLFQTEWRSHLDGVDVVVSSLVVHHLDGDGKRQLFRDVADRTGPSGALLIADIVEAQRPEANAFFGATLDHFAAQQSQAIGGDDELYDLYRKEEWNIYFYPDPEFDKPSPLVRQLQWLTEAGFPVADCYWMQAGHAIYGGYKGLATMSEGRLSYADALAIAKTVLASG